MTHSVLIVGSGGREYAMAQRFSADATVSRVFIVPGNPPMNHLKKCTTLSGDVVEMALRYSIDLVVVGPEKPLVEGLADRLRVERISVVGPSKNAAMLEYSKIFSKQFMMEMGIPTARAEWFENVEAALVGLDRWSETDGVVVKSDSLAGGKGVVVCDTITEASTTIQAFMTDSTIRVQTDRILLEEKLYGVEVSAFVLCDGVEWRWLGIACDHKPFGDGDVGPNTGGMGAFIPNDFLSDFQWKEIEDIFNRVVRGMSERGTPYQGVLFAGLMVNTNGVRPNVETQVSVLEFNIRLGDPEAQVLLPTLKGSLFDVFLAAAQGALDTCTTSIEAGGYAVNVVAVAEGYPSIDGTVVSKGDVITTIADTETRHLVFGGVAEQDGVLVTNGGRVLGVTGFGDTLEEARAFAYQGMKRIHFDGMQYRKDIADIKRTLC